MADGVDDGAGPGDLETPRGPLVTALPRPWALSTNQARLSTGVRNFDGRPARK